MDWLVSCFSTCADTPTSSPREVDVEKREPWDLEGWTRNRTFAALLRWLRQNPHATPSFDETFEYTSTSYNGKCCLWIQLLYYYESNENNADKLLNHDEWAELLTLLIRKKINVNACFEAYYSDKICTYSPLVILLFQERHKHLYSCNAWQCLHKASHVLKILKRENSVLNTKQIMKEEYKNVGYEEKSIFWYIDFMYQLAEKDGVFFFDYAILSTLVEDLVALGVDTTFAWSSSVKSFHNDLEVFTIEDTCKNDTFKETFYIALKKKQAREWQAKLKQERLQKLCGVRFRF